MTEPVLVPISALEHWSFCPRQCGLIHVEQVWDENAFTIKGSAAHERADEPVTRTERGVRVERALPLWSDELGLVGRADVVEFVLQGDREVPCPVEYKSGKPVRPKHAALQLCAQALCLEEIFGVDVPFGALYFVATRDRLTVPVDDSLRLETKTVVAEIRSMILSGSVPDPVADARCRNCSLADACMPFAVRAARGTQRRTVFEPLPELRE